MDFARYSMGGVGCVLIRCDCVHRAAERGHDVANAACSGCCFRVDAAGACGCFAVDARAEGGSCCVGGGDAVDCVGDVVCCVLDPVVCGCEGDGEEEGCEAHV